MSASEVSAGVATALAAGAAGVAAGFEQAAAEIEISMEAVIAMIFLFTDIPP